MAPLVWLVTGTSSGFGAAFVDSILAKGDKVIATARGDVSRIDNLKQKGAATVSLDVTAPQRRIDEIVDAAIQIYGRIDVLVNNAAYIQGAVLEELTEELLLRGLKNNLIGPLNLTRAVTKHMRERRTGTIVFMGSVGTYYGGPGSIAYCSGKGAIDSLVPTLSMELAPWNIRCTTVVPGYFRTNVMKKGHIKFEAPNRLPEYVEMNKAIEAGCYGAHGNQPGDPRKGTDIVVDVVHGDGIAQGKGWPDRLPLGPDGLAAVRQNSISKLVLSQEWEKVCAATDFSS